MAMPAEAQNNGMWRTNGNNATGNRQFVGTTDSPSLVFKTRNTERMRLKGNGTPTYRERKCGPGCLQHQGQGRNADRGKALGLPKPLGKGVPRGLRPAPSLRPQPSNAPSTADQSVFFFTPPNSYRPNVESRWGLVDGYRIRKSARLKHPVFHLKGSECIFMGHYLALSKIQTLLYSLRDHQNEDQRQYL